jgi:pimeloyl-ACP methyl ester carboxylesterase
MSSVVVATSAQAQDPDPTLYCTGDGGPLGIATDAEHNVLIGDPPVPAGARESRVTVAGVSTRIVQAGPPQARDAIVFLHGNPGSARDWDDLVAANGKFARTVAIDIPGWGKSDKLHPEGQTTDGAATYIQGVLDALGIHRVVLVAHDFGGIWGLQWASQHPDELAGVVLIDTGVLLDYVPHPLAIVWATPGAGELQVASTTRASFHQAVQYMQPRPLPDAFIDRMYDDYDRATRCGLLRYYRSVRDATITDSNALARKQADALKKRTRPALVIWGAKDPYIPPEQAYKQREAFPGARVEVFQDSAHWPFVDNAARTRALVVPFLRPRLTATRPRAVAGARRLRVQVSVTGMLPAYRVRALLTSGGRSAGSSGAPVTVSGTTRLTLLLRRPLGAGRYLLTVRSLGLPTRRVRLRVAAAARRLQQRRRQHRHRPPAASEDRARIAR